MDLNSQNKILGKLFKNSNICIMKLSQTMSAYKRRKREVKRTSQKLLYVKKKKTKFKKDNIVKLKGGGRYGLCFILQI